MQSPLELREVLATDWSLMWRTEPFLETSRVPRAGLGDGSVVKVLV